MQNRNLNKEGVGLGLAVSKNIAKALGGDILVESLPNIGSKFTLVLPYQRTSTMSLTQTEETKQDEYSHLLIPSIPSGITSRNPLNKIITPKLRKSCDSICSFNQLSTNRGESPLVRE